MTTAWVEIVSPGALALVQDLGRFGWRRYGVPRAGALDDRLLRIANRLAGNDDGAPAIEFFVAGPSFKAIDSPLRLGFAGDFSLTLTRGGEATVFDAWRSVTLLPGDTLSVGQPRCSRVGYVALAGLAVPQVLGSASTYTRSRLGGIDGRALVAGDRLQVAAVPAPQAGAPAAERVLRSPPAAQRGPIHVVPGPQDDYFDEAAWALFTGAAYQVSREADRMGVRLEGPALAHRAGKSPEIVTDATLPGSVQVPGNGLPIVLLADGQTAGGYPKIATVASADLPRLATAPVGAGLRFECIDVAGAEALAREREAQTRQLLSAVEPMTLVDGVDLTAIYEGNLISAMVDALDPD